MTKKSPTLLPHSTRQMQMLGLRIKAARLRRNLSQAIMAERAGLALATYRALESGNPSSALGAYVAAMQVLGVQDDLGHLVREDILGRTLQDEQLQQKASPRNRPKAPSRRPVEAGSDFEDTSTPAIPTQDPNPMGISIDDLIKGLE